MSVFMSALSLTTLPFSVLTLYAFVFGVIIGSFLNVYIYRFHTGKSLSGHSHCLSCGTPLKPYELIPLLSYVFLRGRCRTCGCKIPARYFLVELTAGLLVISSSAVYLAETAFTTSWIAGSMNRENSSISSIRIVHFGIFPW